MLKEDEDVNHSKKETDEYFFKNILFFTNDRDAKNNKTLKNIEDAIKLFIKPGYCRNFFLFYKGL